MRLKLWCAPAVCVALQLHRVSGTLVQAGVYQQQLSNLTLLVAFIHAHRHAQEVLREHIQVHLHSLGSLLYHRRVTKQHTAS